MLDGRLNPHAPPGDGGDGPAWSRKRQPYEPPPRERGRSVVPYAELHAHSAFSFLDGASLPEEMVQEAARLDLKALAITDHDGFYGVVRFAEAAKELGLPTVFGAELSLGGAGQYRGFGTSAGIGSWPGGVSEVVAADGRRASVGWNAQRPEGQATL